MPMTPFSGVRISWLMLARNSDFRREASSAAACACASSSWLRWRSTNCPTHGAGRLQHLDQLLVAVDERRVGEELEHAARGRRCRGPAARPRCAGRPRAGRLAAREAAVGHVVDPRQLVGARAPAGDAARRARSAACASARSNAAWRAPSARQVTCGTQRLRASRPSASSAPNAQPSGRPIARSTPRRPSLERARRAASSWATPLWAST